MNSSLDCNVSDIDENIIIILPPQEQSSKWQNTKKIVFGYQNGTADILNEGMISISKLSFSEL